MSVLPIHSRCIRLGASLLELLVVLAIVAILVSLLLVAVQYSHALARRTVCQNNLRQLSLAMRSYTETRKRYPDICPPDQAGGWVVALMPFLEEQTLQDELKSRPALSGENVSPLARQRPSLFTCPDGFDGNSSLPGRSLADIPATHYLYCPPPPPSLKGRHFSWTFLDALQSNRLPWAAGPEGPQGYTEERGAGFWPHSGGYNKISSWNESCSFVVPSG
jgi:type II secretory pathway pseudopilin PulG